MIERKKRYCRDCGNLRYIFSHKRCKFCDAVHRLKRERLNKPSVRPLDKRSPSKGKNPPLGTKMNSWGYFSQLEMFRDIWDKMESPRICPISNRKLDKLRGGDKFHWCFAHILPKGRYKFYRLNPDNILVVHPDVHNLIDQGTQEQRDKTGWDFSVFFNMKEKLKISYETFVKSI